jgi:hypothetical protein
VTIPRSITRLVLTHHPREPVTKRGGTTYGGVRLFDDRGSGTRALERTRVIESPAVTHLRYRVVK